MMDQMVAGHISILNWICNIIWIFAFKLCNLCTYFTLNKNLIKRKHCLILSVEDQVLEVDAMNFVGFIKIGLHILSSKTYFSHNYFAIQWSK